MVHEEIRKYEISVWTLQDNFITVLKWSDLVQKGCIENAQFDLNDDSIDKLSFEVPMYIRQEKELVENPIWYNTRNGILLEGMRKLKLIINKQTEDEGIYELLITKVVDEHSGDILTCSITAENLAFHELGKLGYKISLSYTNFENEYNKWVKGVEDGSIPSSTPAPANTLQFWCENSTCCNIKELPDNATEIDPHQWYYKIQMKQNHLLRSSHKIYEEPYPMAWDPETLQPKQMQELEEKRRVVEIEHSNLYNITQTIAETYQVFCRYEYGHDENYHITSKTIVFFNDLSRDKEKLISLSYPHSSQSITRETDSTDIVTKLYVTYNDETDNIIMSTANKTGEDYILNFDYMHDIGAITEEQYKEVGVFEDAVARINSKLNTAQLCIGTVQNALVEAEADKTLYTNSLEESIKQLNANTALKNNLVNEYGNGTDLQMTNKHPDSGTILTDSKTNNTYINLSSSKKGIKTNTVRIYETYNTVNNTLSNEITGFSFVYDEYNAPIKIIHIGQTERKVVYLTYDYDPATYYDSIIKIWQTKVANDTAAKEEAEERYDKLEMQLVYFQGQLDDLIADKNKLLWEFQRMMGPALREGWWTPNTVQNRYQTLNDTKVLPNTFEENVLQPDSGTDFLLGWDSELFPEEQKGYYKLGVLETETYYPYIDVSSFFGLSNFYMNFQDWFVIFNDSTESTLSLKNVRLLGIGSEVVPAFIKKNNSVIPVLIISGATTLTDDQIARMKSTGFIGSITIDSVEGISDTSNFVRQYSISSSQWGTLTADTPVVYPRIKFSSLNFQANSTLLNIAANGKQLEKYKDYYILTRDTMRDGIGYLEYFLTIKPEALFSTGKLPSNIMAVYALSQSNTAIYLDAKDVAKENAYPKVSYTITPTLLHIDLNKVLYKYLDVIVMINDVDLKLTDTFGYISHITLQLDDMSKDKIEIKNYTNKFEDLFSSIMASNEVIKQRKNEFLEATRGNIGLSPIGAANFFEEQKPLIDSYLDNYLDTSPTVEEKLHNIFTEAGNILSHASSTLGQAGALSVENATILGDFAQDIRKDVVPLVMKTPVQPADFKVGDIWIKTDQQGNEIGRYVATSNSDYSLNGYGFTRTYDGSLAQITGAGMDIDTVAGTTSIYAKNELKMESGGFIKIAGNDIEIVGNKKVTIGGAMINIATLVKEGTTYQPSGINLIASSYNEDNLANSRISKVLLTPNSITMGAATMTFKAASTINMIASTGTAANTSAIKLDADTGIWIGSGKSIRLFSGTGTSGSNVSITPTHIFLGTTSGSSASAFDMTPDYIIMAVGTNSTNFTSSNVEANSTNSIVGLKITRQSFGLATGSGTGRAVMIMNSAGVLIGAGNTPEDSGSYVRITGTKVEIGSTGILSVNMTNFKLQTDSTNGTSFAVGENFGTITSVNSVSASDTWVGMIYNKNGFFIHGNVVAQAFIAQCSTGYLKAEGNNLGFYDSNNKSILNLNGSGITCGGDFNITTGHNLIAESGKTEIDSTSGRITFSINRYSTVSSLPSSNTNYRAGDLVYVTSGSNQGLWKLGSNGSWTKVSSASQTSTEVTNYVANAIAMNSFQVTDDGLIICDRIICRGQVVSQGGFYGTVQGQASSSQISQWSSCTGCGGGCGSTCSKSCGGGCAEVCGGNCSSQCANDCSGGCSGSCGNNCQGTCSGTAEGSSTCTGCTGSCSGNCTGACSTACAGSSGSSCSTCTATCSSGCGEACTGNCTGYCTDICTWTCGESGCYGTCYDDCAKNCSNTCADICKGSTEASGGSSGCSSYCTGGCTKGCTSSCGSGCANGCGDSCSSSCVGGCGTTCEKGCVSTCSTDCTGANYL